MYENDRTISRRGFFRRSLDGLQGAALLSLLSRDLYAAQPGHTERRRRPRFFDLAAKRPHFVPRATSVIHLCMQGGPSQVDLFDPKPALDRHHGQSIPATATDDAFQLRSSLLMRSPWKFARYGASGAPVSELLPHTARHVDDFAIIRSMYNVHPNHEPAIYKMQSGQIFPGHPVFGSWIAYGLGNASDSLPAYVVLADPSNRLPTNGVMNWQSGYLPPIYQGTPMRASGAPMLNLEPDYDEPALVTSAKRDLLARMDRIHRDRRPLQPQLDARIRNYELAARMQLSAAEALDIAGESAVTEQMYGIGQKETDSFGRRCLLARRLVERGVRFVQIYPRGQLWDNHRNLTDSITAACRQTDLPVAGLLADLKQRGLLDSTLVVWAGEFGRLPLAQVQSEAQMKTAGRDHGPYGFTIWMAGGGVRAGTTYGATDEFGFAAVEKRVSIQDWHATMLHLLGLHHEELFFERNGLNEKLTHTHPTRIVHDVIA